MNNRYVVSAGLLIFAVCALFLSVSVNGQTLSTNRIVELPTPTGKYAIGRTSFHWTDASRPEAITDDLNDHRELIVTVWYPTDSATGQTAPYMDNLEKIAEAGAIDKLRVTFIRSLHTHTIEGARISSAERRYPVLLFSPGNGLNSVLYTTQIEDLASHGYVVLGIDHPYESLCVFYPDGRIARYRDLQPNQNVPNVAEEQFRSYRQRVDWRAADAVFVLNQLEKLANGKPASQFKGRLDLTRIGALGHSIGGVAAAQFCQIDQRFKACLNLDGHVRSLPLFPDSDGKGPRQPFMIFEDVLPEPTDQQLADWKTTREKVKEAREKVRNRVAELLKSVKSGSYRITISGSRHQSFSDEPFIYGSSDANVKAANLRRAEIICLYTLAFFDQHLKNRNSNLLNGSSGGYPEIAVERFSPAQQ